jgi:cell division septum initiation protein DivIVA
MSLTETIASSNDRLLDVVTSVQEQILEGTKTLVAAIELITPEVDPLRVDQLPSAKDLIERAFDFQTRLTEANRVFAAALADTLTAPATN